MPGMSITVVYSEASLLAYLIQQPRTLPSLIILDLYMPLKADGLQILATLRTYYQQRGQAPTPIVVLSHSNQEEDVKQCYDLGVNAYMVKPPRYEQWVRWCHHVGKYWLQTVTLPLHN